MRSNHILAMESGGVTAEVANEMQAKAQDALSTQGFLHRWEASLTVFPSPRGGLGH